MDQIIEVFRRAAHGDVQAVFLVVSVYVFLGSVYSLVHQFRVDRWPSTKGKLIQGGSGNYGVKVLTRGNRDHPPNALYEYDVDGTHYFGARVSPWGSVASHNIKFILDRQIRGVGLDETGGVDVYYDPGNPRRSVLIRTGNISRLISVVLAVTPLALYLHTYGFHA
ncbi:MAG: DUF3592 domain-containing protein [Betaproteobacteria bacterium]|nr:DUF3592 domain-containing protein [Betaproteobacteria bacterium]